MTEYVWIRLGDVAEYEKFDTPYDAGLAVGERIGIGKPEPLAFHYRAAGVAIPPAFVGDNYISLFWGDENSQWTRDLTNVEKRHFEDGVGQGILGGEPSSHSSSLTVKFWDGTSREAKNRDEAVRVIKEGLKAWMQEGDRIIWYNTSRDDELGRKPSYAVVVNEVGEETDASAMIIYHQ